MVAVNILPVMPPLASCAARNLLTGTTVSARPDSDVVGWPLATRSADRSSKPVVRAPGGKTTLTAMLCRRTSSAR